MPKLTSSNLSQQLQEGTHYILSLPCSVDNYLARLKNTVSGHRKKNKNGTKQLQITKTKFFLGFSEHEISLFRKHYWKALKEILF
jgi:hypothetical protein